MIKSGFSYLKLAAVVAVLTITIMAGVRPSTATKQPPPVATPADLSNEERALAKYFDDFVAYDSECAKLGKQAVLEHIHINPVQAKSDDLKRRLPELQNTIREIVKKLKAANEWDDLNTSLAAKITDGTSNTFFKETSFKQLLEESSNNLISHGNEISIPLDNLRKKLTSRTFSPYGDGADLQIVRAAYEAPAPMKFVSVRCSIGRARIGLGIKLGHYPSIETINSVAGACGENGTYNPF
jgi:hypothetical protein